MRQGTVWMLSALMVAGPVAGGRVAAAQRDDSGYRNGYRQTQPYNDTYDRQHYRGDRDHGNHDDHGNRDNRGNYDNRGDYDRHQGGIGPGKGALIGGGAGALLGGLLGGGLKGTLIGGGVGAGGGALLGKAHQNSQRNKYDDNRDYRDRDDRDGHRY